MYRPYLRVYFLLIVLALISSSCSESKKLYNSETFGEDISSFSEEEQTLLDAFHVTYGKYKAESDSIYGLAVAQVDSLTYSELLNHLKDRYYFFVDNFGYTTATISRYIEGGRPAYLDGLTCNHWYVNGDFLKRDELPLIAGRKYDPEFDKNWEPAMISKAMADRTGLFVGDKVEINGKELLIIALFANHEKDKELVITELVK
ncbi:MAG: hypothetical protein Roseis2KO_26680 [Roseivirga sp.]